MNSDLAKRAQDALALFNKVFEHATFYKEQFHAMQEQMWRWQDLAIQREKKIKRQSQIIAELEKKAGIDTDL